MLNRTNYGSSTYRKVYDVSLTSFALAVVFIKIVSVWDYHQFLIMRNYHLPLNSRASVSCVVVQTSTKAL